MNKRAIARPVPFTGEQLAVADKRIRATCHPKQAGFVFDTAPRVSLCTGRGAGKTSAMLMRLVRRLLKTPGANCLYIAATRESAERLAWADLKKIITLSLRVAGTQWNESKLICTLRNGSKLYLFGCDDKGDINKLRGITYHEVGVDETASIRRDLLAELLDEVIGPRNIGAIAVLGTPGKILAGLFFEATAPATAGDGHRPYEDRDLPEFAGWKRWSSHAWNILDGIAAGIEAMILIYAAQLEEKARKGWSDTNPIWLREYMGKWSADLTSNVYAYRPLDDHGKPWNQWEPKILANGFAALPDTLKDVGYGIGIDVGFKDAFALEVFAFSYSDPKRTLYHVYEVYRTRLGARDIARLIIGPDLNHQAYGGIIAAIGWPAVMVGDFAGSGGALLKELTEVYSITITAADKPYRYKDNAIELMNSDLHEGFVKLMKTSKLAEEMLTLQWVEDAAGRRAENKGQANHGCDAALYLRNELAVLLPSAAADAPPTTPTTRAAPAPRTAPELPIERRDDDDSRNLTSGTFDADDWG